MKIVDRLMEEHRLIEKAVGSFVTFTRAYENKKTNLKPLKDYAEFFRDYIDSYHHGKEEEFLMPAFVTNEIALDSPPIQMIYDEHNANKEIINSLVELSKKDNLETTELEKMKAYALSYCAGIWEHIDKEDSVLFEEVKSRFSGGLKKELDVKLDIFEKNNSDKLKFEEIMNALFKEFPPIEDLLEVQRGDGCTSCRHFGDGCEGIEKEWWTEEEWETFHGRYT